MADKTTYMERLQIPYKDKYSNIAKFMKLKHKNWNNKKPRYDDILLQLYFVPKLVYFVTSTSLIHF